MCAVDRLSSAASVPSLLALISLLCVSGVSRPVWSCRDVLSSVIFLRSTPFTTNVRFIKPCQTFTMVIFCKDIHGVLYLTTKWSILCLLLFSMPLISHIKPLWHLPVCPVPTPPDPSTSLRKTRRTQSWSTSWDITRWPTTRPIGPIVRARVTVDPTPRGRPTS